MHDSHVNSSKTKTQTAATQKDTDSLYAFRPFSWLNKDERTPDRDLLAMAKDISAGVALTLQLIERSNLDREYGDAPLSVTDCGQMERLAISACNMLSRAVESRFDDIRNAEGK